VGVNKVGTALRFEPGERLHPGVWLCGASISTVALSGLFPGQYRGQVL